MRTLYIHHGSNIEMLPRSVNNFMVNIVGALIAHSLHEKKPSLNLNAKQLIEVAC